MNLGHRYLTVCGLILALAGCADSDPPATTDAGTDAGRDAGRDMGADLGAPDFGTPDLGVDLGPPDLGPPDMGPATEGETCASATPILEGTVTAQSTMGFTNDYEGGMDCRGTAGLDRVYSITVPNGKRLTALVSSAEGSDMAVGVIALANCGDMPRTCLASSDAGGDGQADLGIWDNDTGAPVVVAIIVDNYEEEDTGGTFDLTVTLSNPPATGDTCGTPTPIAGTGGVASPETLIGYANDYRSIDSSSCISMAGVDHVYSISVPAGKILTASVAPFGVWDPSINVVVGPSSNCSADPIECQAGADGHDAGDPDTAVYTNDTEEDQTVFIIIDSYDGRQGTYTLTTSVHT